MSVLYVIAALCIGTSFGFCWREIANVAPGGAVMDLLTYGGPLIAIGDIAGLVYPDQPAAVLSAQAVFVVLWLLGFTVEAMLWHRDGRDA